MSMVLAKEGSLARGLEARTWPGAGFVRYLLAGLASFLVDFSVLKLLTSLGTDVLVANLVSRPLGGWTCFFVNRSWTFRRAAGGSIQGQVVRFWCVFGVSLLLSEGLIGLFCKWMGFADMAGKALAEAIVVVFNFLALKHWTFR